jgi:hypothetical protein
VKTAQFPKAFASMGSGLGKPKRYFPVKNLNRIGSLVAFFCLLGGSVLVFLDGLNFTYLAYQKHGPVMIEDVLTVPGVVASILFLAGLAAGWWAYANWTKGVVVYEQGFAIRNRRGIQPWRWEEIVSLTAAVTSTYASEIPTGLTHVYYLINRENQRLVLKDGFSKVEELAIIIQEAITPILYNQAARQFNAGQRLVFGPVEISKSGIQVGGKTYAWAEIKQISIQRGIIKVSQKDGNRFSGASAPASAIPNLSVLLNIVQQVVGLKVG